MENSTSLKQGRSVQTMLAKMMRRKYVPSVPPLPTSLVRQGRGELLGPGTKTAKEAPCERSEQKFFSIAPFRLA